MNARPELHRPTRPLQPQREPPRQRSPSWIRSLGALVLAGSLTVATRAATIEPDPNPPRTLPPSAVAKLRADLELVNPSALRRSITNLMWAFPHRYPDGKDLLAQVDGLETRLPAVRAALTGAHPDDLADARAILTLQRRALLANPLLDFDRLLLIKRKPLGDPRRSKGDPENDKGLGKFLGLPQQSSWQLHTMQEIDGWDNEIAVLPNLRQPDPPETLYRPPDGRLVSEMDLHFDAETLLFSMPDEGKLWQIYEIGVDGHGLHQLSGDQQPDVHNFDSCYLPDDRIAYISTAPFQGVPCNASVNVGMTYLMHRDGSNIRQLCFEQDHNFCPTVMNDGRILYLRWEYTDIPHVWARFLFTMNPDGTTQREYYGSGGYWPNSIFFARPVPNHPTRVVGIVTGHHVGRVGELVLLDPARGRRETDGLVQRIPGYGQVAKPLIEDKLTLETYPKFLHPWPLSDQYFLVACKPRPEDLWGIYLVDVFDNLLCLQELDGFALLEPIPLRKTKRPPVIPDKVDLSRQDAIVYLENIYTGPGLQGVPRGSVRQLRLFTYHFSYHGIAGINHRVGVDGPWEPKRVLGTVPVESDGSAMFRVPANTPISIQPLDDQGRALQLMRSWMTAMPGEVVSCIGCHQKQNAVPPAQRSLASRKPPSEIQPWRGPSRGFSFPREVQPVLDRYCVSCHNGQSPENGRPSPDFRADQNKYVVLKDSDPQMRVVENTPREELVGQYGGVFPPAYVELRRYVRVGGFESDLHLLNPGEFHANTSPLFQMLRKGHHGVTLDTEAWDRLATWIDLNTPCHGTWSEVVGTSKTCDDRQRRLDLRERYGGDTEDPEAYPPSSSVSVEPVLPVPVTETPAPAPTVPDWPFSPMAAQRRQQTAEAQTHTLGLGHGVALELVRIPAGRFVMGSTEGHPDERPLSEVDIERPFWIGKYEVSNEVFARFDPTHDSRFEHKGSWIFSENHLGWPLNRPRQPVVRVSWEEAQAFCRWLSRQTGLKVCLPTEAQWEWACRAGSAQALSYGSLQDDFSPFANLADSTIRNLAYDTDGRYTMDLLPRDDRFNDGQLVTAQVGSYRPNAWGVFDMHGNAWEWTRSQYQPYPYHPNDGRNDEAGDGERVVRGGSWYDRPERSRSAFRLSFAPWQKVYHVGFRVVIEPDPPLTAAARTHD